MKTKQSMVCGFIAVIITLLLTACGGGTKELKLTGTDKFKFTAINGGTAYSVSKGSATAGVVNIPAYYRPDAKNDYLPVTEIGRGAFSGSSSTSIVVPPTFTGITIPSTVTSIGISAFLDCASLVSITIPSSVTEIGAGAFSGCASLASITIPTSVTEIGKGAFRSCTSLASVTISEGVTSIGEMAFFDCTSIANITIPASVRSIGQFAFHGCTNLSSITIPSSVTEISAGAFLGWTSSQTINIEGYANQASADRVWGGWRDYCNAQINYLGIGDSDAQTDSRLNGTWAGESSVGGKIYKYEYKFHDGRYEAFFDGFLVHSGVYTTDGSSLVTIPSQSGLVSSVSFYSVSGNTLTLHFLNPYDRESILETSILTRR